MTRSRDDHQIFSSVSFLLFDLLWQPFQQVLFAWRELPPAFAALFQPLFGLAIAFLARAARC